MQYVRLIYAYMGFAGFSIFFVLAGIILIELLQTWHVHLDFISFTYILWNFAAVGALTLFILPAPLLMKQCYLIITGGAAASATAVKVGAVQGRCHTLPCHALRSAPPSCVPTAGVVTAYVFTWIPEWTTWMLVTLMALYDVVAVLVPGGPLKMLVELAQEREEVRPAAATAPAFTLTLMHASVWATEQASGGSSGQQNMVQLVCGPSTIGHARHCSTLTQPFTLMFLL